MKNLETVWSASELIGSGLAYTVMGILVVFMILIIIMLVIKAMELFSVEKKVKSKDVAGTVTEKEEQVVVESVAQQSDDSELIAVITAAVAVAMGKSSSSDFVIRSYKRVQGDSWNKAGRREVLDNRI